MKQVFANAQCMHVYAQQSQDQGRTNNGNVFFSGATIYSYGHHFPMCHILDDGMTALYNDDSYSVSTSSHQADLRQAISHYNIVRVSTRFLKKYLFGHSFDKSTQDTLTAEALEKMQSNLDSAAHRRAEHLKATDISNAITALRDAVAIFEAFGKKAPRKITSRIETITRDTESILNMARDRLAKQAAKDKRIKAQKQKEMQKDADRWLKGGHVMYISRFDKTLMRVNGDKIETSKGAQFPVNHAKRVFPLIREVREHDKFTGAQDVNIRLGHFTVQRIDKNGDVKAGCHFVKWDQIERCARELNIYP